jgi:hypothetical protein
MQSRRSIEGLSEARVSRHLLRQLGLLRPGNVVLAIVLSNSNTLVAPTPWGTWQTLVSKAVDSNGVYWYVFGVVVGASPTSQAPSVTVSGGGSGEAWFIEIPGLDTSNLSTLRTDLEPSANLQKVSVSRAAELFNVSERSIQTAGNLLDHGAPELVQAVESGRVSVSAAADVAELWSSSLTAPRRFLLPVIAPWRQPSRRSRRRAIL